MNAITNNFSKLEVLIMFKHISMYWLEEIGSKLLDVSGGKLIGFLLDKLSKIRHTKSKVSFCNVSLEYHYSLYDNNGNHVVEGGIAKIYRLYIRLGVLNSDDEKKVLRNMHIVGTINSHAIKFQLFDCKSSTWGTSQLRHAL
jgi:hypothetical protein